MTSLAHSWYLTQRLLRALLRQPWYVAITLIQPTIWLLLFGALFKRVVDIPGFSTHSYIDFLAPGVVVMSALFSGGWSGMGVINDIDRGVMDRLLVSPVRRGAIMVGRVAHQAVTTAVQSLIIVGLALLAGAHLSGGVVGVSVVLLAAILLAGAVASLSNALALMLRREESVIAAVQFVALPATFLSSAFMQASLMPHWMRLLARGNPVDWAIVASRQALSPAADWAVIGAHLAMLIGFTLACGYLATRAFRAYQRSV